MTEQRPNQQNVPRDPDATRPQKPGEAATTRFGMEEGDNTDVPATGTDPERQSP